MFRLASFVVAAFVLDGFLNVAAVDTAATVPQVSGKITGVVVEGAQQTPIGGASVQMLLRSAGRVVQSGTQVTNGVGQFSFDALQGADELILRARKLGYSDGEFGQQVEGVGGRAVVLKPGTWPRDLNVPLWRQAALAGSVLAARGTSPVSHLRISEARRSNQIDRRSSREVGRSQIVATKAGTPRQRAMSASKTAIARP